MNTPPDLAVQLYSLREECAEDLLGVLRRLAAIGYAGVEFAGFHGHRVEAIAEVLNESGLRVSSMHGNPPLDDSLPGFIEVMALLNCELLVVPVLGVEDPSDPAQVQQTCREVNALNEAVRGSGISVGFHNHWWEFDKLPDGSTLFDQFREGFDPSVFFEVDVYWVTVGGVDAAGLLGELGPRARLLHVKDGPADTPDSDMVAVGDGTVEIEGILSSHSAAEWHIVELDTCATDMFEAVERSFNFLTEAGLSLGSK